MLEIKLLFNCLYYKNIHFVEIILTIFDIYCENVYYVIVGGAK